MNDFARNQIWRKSVPFNRSGIAALYLWYCRQYGENHAIVFVFSSVCCILTNKCQGYTQNKCPWVLLHYCYYCFFITFVGQNYYDDNIVVIYIINWTQCRQNMDDGRKKRRSEMSNQERGKKMKRNKWILLSSSVLLSRVALDTHTHNIEK